jgi:hypothetical protein
MRRFNHGRSAPKPPILGALILMACIANTLIRISLEFAIVSFATFNLSSDVGPNLIRQGAGVTQVIENLFSPLLLSIVALWIIDRTFNCRQWLSKKSYLSNDKAILASEFPHVILKTMVLAWVNIGFLGISGMFSAISILIFCLLDRCKPVSQVFSLIFGQYDSLLLQARFIKAALELLFCMGFTTPILWLGADYIVSRRLPIHQIVVFVTFNIYMLLSLFRMIKVDRLASP